MSDCKTENGMTMGLIDSIITIAHVLGKRDLDEDDVETSEALRDLRTDEDDLLWPMVALQGHFKLHVLPLAESFPIHLRVNVGGRTVYERVLALD